MTDSERIDELEDGFALLALRAQNWHGIDPQLVPGMQIEFSERLQAICNRSAARQARPGAAVQ